MRYDVAIIGGGPAGSCAATLLAKSGRRVLVIEREKFPRFHIGESLLPFSMKTFRRLGVEEKLQKQGYIEKMGGEIVSGCGAKSIQFFFKNGYKSKEDHCYQVLRSEFDKLLLDHAAESGAEVREETAVEKVDFHPEKVVLTLKNGGEPGDTIEAGHVIDASGRTSVIGSSLKLKQKYHDLDKFSVYAHFDGVFRAEGAEGTLTRMVREPDRWFWMIPLHGGRTSIGVVTAQAEFKKSGLGPEAYLHEAIAGNRLLADRMKGSKRISPVYAAGDYSYRSEKFAGDRWLLAGDAAGFIDPVFSSGVFLALLSGEMAADAIDLAIKHPGKGRKYFSSYETRLRSVMDIYLQFVRAWYQKEFIEVFLTPTEKFQIAPAVNAILAGNLGHDFALRWRTTFFFLVIAIQKYLPLSPRLSLKPQTSPA